MPSRNGYRIAKRVLDVAAASLMLLVLSPLLLASLAAIRISLGAPVFFRQARIGLHDRPFRIWKLRTMNDRRNACGALLPDAERLTPLGRFLRTASLDELPQLWNVLRGEMSLVGPRPLLPQYLPRYSLAQRRRHDALPGITGWAQVNGRNDLNWERRFELDLWYVDHRGMALDLRILWMTAARVLGRSGISSRSHATMPEFMGASEEMRHA